MRAIRTFAIVLVALAALASRAEALKSHHQKSLAPKPGQTLTVEGTFHDITVTLKPGATAVDVTVDIEITKWPGDGKEYLAALAPTFEEGASGIKVRSAASGFSHFGMVQAKGSIDVTLPPGMGLSLKAGSGDITVTGDLGNMPLACAAGSGDVRVTGRASGFTSETGSGSVTAKLEGPCGKVSLEAGSGDIDFTGAAAAFSAEAGSGSVSASGLSGPATIETGSGDVEVRIAALSATDRVRAETGSGEVRLALPAALTPSGVLETGSGDIECAFKGTENKRGNTYSLSGPGPEVHVETGSGDIVVTAAK